MSQTTNQNQLLGLPENLPIAYIELLKSFKSLLVLELENQTEVELHSLEKLVAPISDQTPRYQMIESLMREYLLKNTKQTLFCRNTQSEIDALTLKENFYFGKLDSDAALILNLEDFSIWEFWLDDNSIAKLADTFEQFLGLYTIVEKDQWNIYLNPPE